MEPSKIKLIIVIPIFGIKDSIAYERSVSVNILKLGSAKPKISKVITIPKIPSVMPINLPGSISKFN